MGSQGEAKKRRASISRAAQKIRDLCAEFDISYAELSRRTGISVQAMQGWFRGEWDVSFPSRQLVARAFGLRTEELLFEDDEPLPADARESQKAVDQYIATPFGRDLTEEQRDQLYRASIWVPGRAPLTFQEVHALAGLLQLRFPSERDSTEPQRSGNGSGRRRAARQA